MPYFSGTKALDAQIKNLKNRENLTIVDDKMVEIDRDLKKLQRIDSGFDSGKEEYSDFIAKKFSGFDVVQVLSAPSKPVKPIAPKKSLVLLIAGILGLLIGSGAVVLKSVSLIPPSQNLKKGLRPSDDKSQELA